MGVRIPSIMYASFMGYVVLRQIFDFCWRIPKTKLHNIKFPLWLEALDILLREFVLT
jgi:hypothetical protein